MALHQCYLAGQQNQEFFAGVYRVMNCKICLVFDSLLLDSCAGRSIGRVRLKLTSGLCLFIGLYFVNIL